jgi:hypothetical protein
MRKTILLLALLLLFCGWKNKTNSKDGCTVATNFLTFYEANYKQIYQRDEFVYEPYYRVNFAEVEKLSERLKLKEYFTEEFRKNFFKKYQLIDEQLKKEPQEDGTIDGFEADQFLNTQEYDEILAIIKARNFRCSSKKDLVFVTFKKGYTIQFQIVDGKINAVENKLRN